MVVGLCVVLCCVHGHVHVHVHINLHVRVHVNVHAHVRVHVHDCVCVFSPSLMVFLCNCMCASLQDYKIPAAMNSTIGCGTSEGAA